MTAMIAEPRSTLPAEEGPPLWADLDQALVELRAHKDRWIQVSVDDRITILAELRRGFAEIEDRWIAATLEAKGLASGSYGEAEEHAYFAILVRKLRLLQQALRDICDTGRPRIPGGLTTRRNGQVVARVLPITSFDWAVFPGMTGDVWIEPGLTIDDVLWRQAAMYQQPPVTGSVALVLGSGNFGFLPVTDVLYKLFVADEVAALKLHPLHRYLGPLLEEAFRALIGRGYLRLIYGAADVGGFLCTHPFVDTIHLTGSDATYDAIVFGPGAEGAARKKRGRPLLEKPVSAELGNVTPVLVVPGPWSQADIQRQAMLLASAFVQNASAICATPRLIIQQREWPQRSAFLAAFERILMHVPPRRAFYPGARRQLDELLNSHPRARRIGRAADDQLPWTIVPDLDPTAQGEGCFGHESFCPAIGETAFDASDPVMFLEQAVEFLNERVWGTLAATIFVHPRTLRESRVRTAFEQAVEKLRYGTVTINTVAQYAVLAGVLPWGAFPGASIGDIQSGIGKVSNPLMLPSPQKSVLRAPFHAPLMPLALDSRHVVDTFRALVRLEQDPSTWRLLRMAWPAIRG